MVDVVIRLVKIAASRVKTSFTDVYYLSEIAPKVSDESRGSQTKEFSPGAIAKESSSSQVTQYAKS